MISVQVKNGNVEAALKKFKNKVAKSGLPSEVRKKQQYDKPGVQRRNAKKEAIKNSRKAAKRERNAA
ncbi:MAG: 30S ribosomal protein S21 [Bacilli bacterium]|nr:30S ribosomal protein S21 [Bacilli bacterium]